MSTPVTRRVFLVSSAEAAALVAISPTLSLGDSRDEPCGPVYGRAASSGLNPGTASSPSRGRVELLDGRSLEVSHETGWRIAPGKGVLVAPDGRGGWSVLYAEC
jgi:hypothetical protein